MKLHLRCPAQPVLHVGLPEDLLDLVEQGALGLFRLANAVAVNRLLEIEADLVSPVLLQLRVGKERLGGHLPYLIRLSVHRILSSIQIVYHG